jgi:hypothetical protein
MITPFKSDYGCGLYIKRTNGRLMFEHDGNNIGFNSEMAYYPEERIAVIVLANLNGTVTGEIARALAAVARGETPPIPSITEEDHFRALSHRNMKTLLSFALLLASSLTLLAQERTRRPTGPAPFHVEEKPLLKFTLRCVTSYQDQERLVSI